MRWRQSVGFFHSGHGTTILQFNPDGKLVTIDVERNVKVTGMQVRTRWIKEAFSLSPGQDHPADGFGITRPAFQKIAQVQSA